MSINGRKIFSIHLVIYLCCDVFCMSKNIINPLKHEHSEACHKKVQHAFGIAHPTIWKFLEGLKLTITGNDTDYEQFIAGTRPTKKTKYVDLDN